MPSISEQLRQKKQQYEARLKQTDQTNTATCIIIGCDLPAISNRHLYCADHDWSKCLDKRGKRTRRYTLSAYLEKHRR